MSDRFKKFLLFFIAFVITLTSAAVLPFLSRYIPDTLDKIHLSSGAVVLSDDRLNNGNVYLTGEWEFYYNKFIVTDGVKENAAIYPDLIVEVPSSWTDYEINGKSLGNGGRASYRALISNINTSSPLLVSLPDFPGRCNIFIDGQCVFSNTAYSSHRFVNTASPIIVDTGLHEIVAEVQCEYTGGITTLPVLSTYEQYNNNTTAFTAISYMLIGMVFLFCVAAIIFSIVSKEFNRYFWIILLCIIFLFRMLVTAGYTSSDGLFPDFNRELMLMLVFITTYLIKLAMIMHVFNDLKLKIKPMFLVVISALFLIASFVPYFKYESVFVSEAYLWLQSVTYFADVFVIYKLSDAIIKKIRFARIYMLAYCITTVGVVIDNFYRNGYISSRVTVIMSLSCVLFIGLTILVFALRARENVNAAKRAAELSSELSEMHTRLMLSQIQPHFLFNALNTIKYLTKKDPKAAESAIVKFSTYLRVNMDSLSNHDLISFEKEIDHVKNYVSIEQLRFGERLKVEYDIDAGEFMLPPLSIQPMVENAIKHGVNQKPEGGTVKITAKELKTEYVITVEDDGVGFDVDAPLDESRSHVGIANIKARFEEMLSASVVIKSELGSGTVITVSIPKTGGKKNDNNGS